MFVSGAGAKRRAYCLFSFLVYLEYFQTIINSKHFISDRKLMKINLWAILIVITGISLIVVHGLFSSFFTIDYFTVIILVVMCIPYFSQFLKKAKVAGAELEFKDEIENTKKIVKESIEKSKSENAEMKPLPFETFNMSTAKEIVESDHILALASLRIEIEKKLRQAAKFLKLGSSKSRLSEIIDALVYRGVLRSEQVSALRKIIEMCNKAVHGYDITKREAKDIVNLMEELNQSFSIGYSISFYPNENFDKQGLVCEWEHCIEFMPLTSKRTIASCPIFGHNCPEGSNHSTECRKAIEQK